MENIYKINLNNTYGWFSNTIGKSVEIALSDFFENNFKIKLVSISEVSNPKLNPLLKGELFYTCRISIKNKQTVLVRVSSDFIRIVFHDIFGSNFPIFNIENLTELEQRIINSSMEYVSKEFEIYLINEREINKIDPKNKNELTLSFIIKTNDVSAGKLCITFPQNRLSPVSIEKENNFTYDDFIKSYTTVDLIAGGSKISLDDLSNLSVDDILILEKSNSKKMILKTPFLVREFKVNPNPSIMLDFDDDDNEGENIDYKEEYKEEIMPDKSVWDDIQIEVNAEFQKVKMPLGDLKQISKDLVVDLGPIMDNEVSLLVENKVVAKGELVIINDKYGVKITEVVAGDKKPEIKETPQIPPQEKASPPVQKEVKKQQVPSGPPPKPIQGSRPAPKVEDVDDEIDYSDFEE